VQVWRILVDVQWGERFLVRPIRPQPHLPARVQWMIWSRECVARWTCWPNIPQTYEKLAPNRTQKGSIERHTVARNVGKDAIKITGIGGQGTVGSHGNDPVWMI
jgi:hypothetical protein